MNPIQYHRKSQTFTISVKPPLLGSNPDLPDDANYTLEVRDSTNGLLYFGSISSMIALHIQQSFGLTIADFLTQFGKNFIDGKYP
jgi:hypothetical protein